MKAGATIPRFGYGHDPVCLGAMAAYVVNRWLLPAALLPVWWRGHFADLLLIPAALPWWLWLERRLGWRADDAAPRWREIGFVFVLWSMAAELLAPALFAHCTGDAWDVLAYAGGAAFAGVCWQSTTA